MINDYSQQRGVTTLRHHLGDWRYRTKDRPGTLEAYLERLERVIKLCQSVSPPPTVLVMEPPIDRFYFEGNPLEEWQKAMAQVVLENNAILLSLQKEFDDSANRFLFYEFMHPTRLGYELIARRVYEALFSSMKPLLVGL